MNDATNDVRCGCSVFVLALSLIALGAGCSASINEGGSQGSAGSEAAGKGSHDDAGSGGTRHGTGGTTGTSHGTGGTSSVSTGSSGKGGSAEAGSDGAAAGGATGSEMHVPPPPGAPGCGLMEAAFCDTFDKASPGGRGGDLDDANWSVARIAGMGARGVWVPWDNATSEACGKTTTGVIPPNDIFFCAGGGTESMHMNDTQHDGGGFTIHSYRIRKPFDFTGRTGVVSFDVDAKARLPGGHGFWFNITIASEPVPAPYQQGGEIGLFAKAAVLIEFEAASTSNAICEDGGLDGTSTDYSNSVSTIYWEKDYKIEQAAQYLIDRNPKTGCFKTKDEVMNHVEIHLSKTSVEVFASDAGKPETFRSIVKVDKDGDNFELPFEVGYVNLQHTHYNAEKNGVTPPYATYHWDNVAFDGPSYSTPRAYEVPDSLKTYELTPGKPLTDIGYGLNNNGMVDHDGPVGPITLEKVDMTDAKSAEINLNAWGFCPGDTLDYRFNGGAWHKHDCPFSLACEGCENGNTPVGECDRGARAVTIPVEDLSELKQGDNTFELRTSSTDDMLDVVAANIELQVHAE
jgi:hypothetical protein